MLQSNLFLMNLLLFGVLYLFENIWLVFVLVFVFYKKAEMTVLKNLQDNCMGATSDIIKFSVPTETKGTSRMKKTFSEEKPLFQGYVFVYCKLTQESYDSIAEVKSVRG